MYIGNQTAIQFEGIPQEIHSNSQAIPVRAAGVLLLADSGPATGKGLLILSKKALRAYYKNAIREIKQAHGKRTKGGFSKKLALALGVVAIVLSTILLLALICSISCGAAGAGIALGIMGGVALFALGVWGIAYGSRKTTAPRREPLTVIRYRLTDNE